MTNNYIIMIVWMLCGLFTVLLTYRSKGSPRSGSVQDWILVIGVASIFGPVLLLVVIDQLHSDGKLKQTLSIPAMLYKPFVHYFSFKWLSGDNKFQNPVSQNQ